MVKHTKQAPIKVRTDTAQQIRFLSEKSHLSMTQVLAEIIDAVFTVGCTFATLNLSYDFEISESKVTISVGGKNNLQSGSFEVPSTTSDKKVDKMIAKRLKRK